MNNMNNYDNEENIRLQTKQQMEANATGYASTMQIPCEQSLEDKLHSNLFRLHIDAAKAEKIKEVLYLKEKYPEIFRLIELLDQVK